MSNKIPTKYVELKELNVGDRRLNKDALEDDIDTGVIDGSGSLTVVAGDAIRTLGGDSIFRNVEIRAKSPDDGSHGYAHFDDASLIVQAANMLRQDYCK